MERDNYYGGGYYPTQADTYTFDVSSKKLSLVKKEFKIDSQNGRYILGSPYTGDNGPLPIHLYNAYTKKLYKISPTRSSAKFLKGKVYYADLKYLYSESSSSRKISIKTSSYTCSNQKTLCTIKMESSGYVTYIGSSYVKYAKYNKDYSKRNYYKCYYSLGKIVKTNK